MSVEYKMPGADASQYTQLKKAAAVQSDPVRPDGKNITHLTQFVPRLSGVVRVGTFLPSLTIKFTRPLVPSRINTDFAGKKESLKQNCS
jgi:hypothetical protein